MTTHELTCCFDDCACGNLAVVATVDLPDDVAPRADHGMVCEQAADAIQAAVDAEAQARHEEYLASLPPEPEA